MRLNRNKKSNIISIVLTIFLLVVLLPGTAFGAGPEFNGDSLNIGVYYSNTYIRVDVTFNEGIYGDAGHSTAVDTEDFEFEITNTKGTVTKAEITSIYGGSVAAGANQISFNVHLKNDASTDVPPTGGETITLRPKADSVYNSAGEAMETTQSLATTLPDKRPPAFKATYPKVGDVQAPGSKKIEVVFKTDEGGNYYYVILPTESSTPAAQDIKDHWEEAGGKIPGVLSYSAGSYISDTEIEFTTDPGTLEDATDYDFYMVLEDSEANLGTVEKLAVTTPGAPVEGPIGDFECTNIGSNFAQFSWTPASGATEVKVQYSLDNESTWQNATHAAIGSTAGTVMVTGLSESTAYIFKLVVTGGDNEGDSNSVYASTTPWGNISGKVTDIEGNPLQGASVTLIAGSGVGQNYIDSTSSAADGSYSFSNVPAGTRYVYAAMHGYIVGHDFDVEVQAAATTTDVDFELETILASGYPKVGEAQADGSKKVKLLIKANDVADAYYVVVPNDSGQPTEEQIGTGKDRTGADALYAGSGSLGADTEQSFVSGALPNDGTAYDVYVVLKRGAYWSEIVKLDVTTPPAAAADTTPPEFAAVPLVGGDRHPGSKRVSFTVYPKDETVTAYYIVVGHGSIVPSKEQVRDGNDYGMVDVLDDGSQSNVKTNGYIINPYAELPADDTIYDIYVVISDAAGNLSEPAKIELKTPVKLLATGYPKIGTAKPAGSKQVEILNQANGDSETSYYEGVANAYYVAVADGAPTPTFGQIKNGFDSTGSNALAAGNVFIPTANTEFPAVITLPEDATAYDTYVVLYKSYNSGYIVDIWSEVVRLDVTTPSAAVALSLSSVNPPHGQVGVVYTGHDFKSNTTGGAAPYTYSYTGNLPAGLTLSAEGVLSGTPTASANVELVVTVEDALGATAQQTYNFNIVPETLFINGGELNEATLGLAYEFQLGTVTGGGITPYTWSISSGAIPSGLTLNSTTGYLTGTPTATGTYNFEVTVTDSQTPAKTATGSFTLKVNAPVLVSSITVSGTGGATTMPDRVAGGELQMIATVLPANATNKNVTWSVAPKGPAWSEISPGQIGAGLAEITDGGLLYRGHTLGLVTVRATAQDGSGVYGETDITVTGVRMSYGGVSMIVDGQYQLSAQAVPADTTEFTWKSSNTAVATVSNNGLVTAVSPGTANITAETADGRVGTCSISVAVKPPATMANLTISEGTLTPEFDPNTYEYTATVGNSKRSVTISATSWGDMSVSGDIGTFDLAVGANSFEINVDGGASHVDATYTVVITRLSASGGSGGGGGGGASSSGTSVDSDGGIVEEDGATVDIPKNAVKNTIKVAIAKRSSSGLSFPEGYRLVSSIFDISKDKSGDFEKDVTITLPFDKSKVNKEKDELALYWWNGSTWKVLDDIEVDWSEGTVSGTVDHFTKFAVLAKAKAASVPVEPEEPGLVIVLTPNSNTALINGEAAVLDAPPFIKPETGRTMVPIRFVSENLGAQVDWLIATRQVRIAWNETTILLTIGSNLVLVNGQYVQIDSPAEIVNGRTYVPLRFVGETLGANAEWDEIARTITITK